MTRTQDSPDRDAALRAAQQRLWPDGMPSFARSPRSTTEPASTAADEAAAPAPDAAPPTASDDAPPAMLPPAGVRIGGGDPALGAALRRIDALERSRRSSLVRWMAVLGVVFGLGAAGVAGTADGPPAAGAGDGGAAAMPMAAFDELVVDELTLRGELRVIDDRGQQIASLGRARDAEGQREPLSLSLSSPTLTGPRETVRLAALETGGTFELHTPDRDASITMLSGTTGPFMVLREADRTRVISEQPDAGSPVPERERARTPAVRPPLPAVSAAARDEIDLTSPAAQRIDEGLMVVGLALHDGRLSGRVINASAVRHVDLRLSLEVGGGRGEIRVPMVSPGNSTGFDVSLPEGVDAGSVSTARIAYAGSTVRYHGHEVWGAAAASGE